MLIELRKSLQKMYNLFIRQRKKALASTLSEYHEQPPQNKFMQRSVLRPTTDFQTRGCLRIYDNIVEMLNNDSQKNLYPTKHQSYSRLKN